MMFGMVSGAEGVNFGHPIVTSGDFAYLCGSACSHQAVIWDGEWGWPRHLCIRWGSMCFKVKVLFWGFFSICVHIGMNEQNDALFAEKCIRPV